MKKTPQICETSHLVREVFLQTGPKLADSLLVIGLLDKVLEVAAGASAVWGGGGAPLTVRRLSVRGGTW